MKVCIIGPVLPFRSGIARHTTALARELARRNGVELSVVSFARQYPAILYPGESELDPDSRTPAEFASTFYLDSMNPLNWRTTIMRLLSARPDFAIIPAWTFFLAPCLGWIARALRRRGVPVVMIVHNAEDHEAAWWKRTLSRFQLRQADRLVTHNAAIAADLARLVPDIPARFHSHPVYDEYPEPRGDLPKRASLELLFFGLVRPYKGLDTALRALAAADLADVRLSIVGEFWQGRAETEALVQELGIGGKVEIIPRYVSDQEVAEYFGRCDAVIAPYRSATGSGVVALAQWYGRPVVASDAPGLSQAIVDGQTGWLFPRGDHAALARLLETEVSRASAETMRPALDGVKHELSWARFADTVLGRTAG